MNRPLTKIEMEAITQPLPMSRIDKLERWAALVEKSLRPIVLGTRIEYRSDRDILYWPYSPMAVAFADQVLKDAGLSDATVGETKRFFEITDEQIHALSCNCGGVISATDMAARIRAMKSSSSLRDAAASIVGPLVLGILIGMPLAGLIIAAV